MRRKFMPAKKYKVNLSEEEKLHLQAVLRKGKGGKLIM